MKFAALAPFVFMVGSAFAKTFTIQVGANGSLTYSPSSITGAVSGDEVAFQFMAKNHTVTQSTFANPCSQSSGGVNSGFLPVQANATVVPQWSFTINNASAPLWFFCAQTGHCGKGMVFAINPTANKSFTAFQQAAMASNGSSTNGSANPSGAAGSGSGGSVTLNPASASNPTATSASSTTTSTSGAAARLNTGNSMMVAGLMAVSGLLAVVL